MQYTFKWRLMDITVQFVPLFEIKNLACRFYKRLATWLAGLIQWT